MHYNLNVWRTLNHILQCKLLLFVLPMYFLNFFFALSISPSNWSFMYSLMTKIARKYSYLLEKTVVFMHSVISILDLFWHIFQKGPKAFPKHPFSNTHFSQESLCKMANIFLRSCLKCYVWIWLLYCKNWKPGKREKKSENYYCIRLSRVLDIKLCETKKIPKSWLWWKVFYHI